MCDVGGGGVECADAEVKIAIRFENFLCDIWLFPCIQTTRMFPLNFQPSANNVDKMS